MVRFGAVVVMYLAVSAAASAQFVSRLEAVRVDVLVTDNGRAVPGLTAADFEVLDNGVPQQVDLATFEKLPLNVVLALDMSASVSGERLEHLRSASRNVIDGLRMDDRAGLVTFNHAVMLRQPLTGDLASLRRALDDVEPGGATALVDGTFAAMLLGEEDAGRDLLIVCSDGRETASWLTPAQLVESARRSDVTVYSVVVRTPGRPRLLDDLAQITGGRVVEVASTTDLSRTFVTILEEFRRRYLVSYSPRGVSREGWHRLQVRLKNRRATIVARAGYQAGEAP